MPLSMRTRRVAASTAATNPTAHSTAIQQTLIQQTSARQVLVQREVKASISRGLDKSWFHPPFDGVFERLAEPQDGCFVPRSAHDLQS